MSPEIRLEIYRYLVTTSRPYLIGRCQEETTRKHNGSPRDFYPGRHLVTRNDDRSRPIQPPITRLCREVRKEALPLFYSENEFWLIHNEFIDEKLGAPRRNFETWIMQTPAAMFESMQHVSLCGYQAWPNRMKIDLDLKERTVTQARTYSTYGDELPTYHVFIERIQEALSCEANHDAFHALEAVLRVSDSIWNLSPQHVSAPPGMSRARQPRSGPEFDW